MRANPLMLLATCVNTPICCSLFHNLRARIARCSASCVNGALGGVRLNAAIHVSLLWKTPSWDPLTPDRVGFALTERTCAAASCKQDVYRLDLFVAQLYSLKRRCILRTPPLGNLCTRRMYPPPQYRFRFNRSEDRVYVDETAANSQNNIALFQ